MLQNFISPPAAGAALVWIFLQPWSASPARGDTAPSLPDRVDFLLSAGHVEAADSLTIAWVHALGPVDDRASAGTAVSWFGGEPLAAAGVGTGVMKVAQNLGVPQYDTAGDHGVCYASRGNSFVIRADGRVNKCTISLDDPANQVGRLEPDGRLILDHDRIMPWMRGLFSGDTKELQCPMIGLADRLFRTSGSQAELEPSRFASSV
jgi:hypothetical protein